MFPFFEAGPQLSVALFALYALLAAASLSIRVAARGAAPSMLSHQINAWWRIFPIVTLALLAFPLGLAALGVLVAVLAVLELESHYAGTRRRFRLGAAAIIVGAIGAGLFLPALAAAVLAIGALLYWRRPQPNTLVWLMLLATSGAMLVLAAFATLPFGARTNLAWALYLFVLTALNDIAQFVSGKLFGRHKIAPGISPNKTWQGLAGGIVVSQAVSLALGSYLALAGAGTLAVFGLLLALAGFAGDLMFSAAKRRLAIKDFSSLIPGHGGILDRVDSLVLTAPLLYCLLRSIE